MGIILCPGFHPPELTDGFVRGMEFSGDRFPAIPNPYYLPYSGDNILQFLENSVQKTSPVIFIGFSAGVVGAIAAAQEWQRRSGCVRALIALDGWGVPLSADFPLHRLSHDNFTHWSSQLLGGDRDSFYADPGVEHLELWRSPQTAYGWWERGFGLRSRGSAAEFINVLIRRYLSG